MFANEAGIGNSRETRAVVEQSITLNESEKSDIEFLIKKFVSIPNYTFEVKNLFTLNISKNKLTIIPEDIGKLKNLQHLDLSHNQLCSLPRSLSEISQLKCLNLSHNNFSLVPAVLYDSLQFLRILDLGYNLVKNFNEPPRCLPYLAELNLQHNKLSVIPRWVFHAGCKIEILNMSNNILNEIDSDYPSNNVPVKLISSLKVLKLENCTLNNASINFMSNLNDLETLTLSNDVNYRVYNYKNHFHSLNVDILQNCKHLKNVCISNVGISFLPFNFGLLNTIQYLDMSGNFLSWLPDSFCDLQCIEVCKLSYNSLSFLPSNIGTLINLREFYVNKNSISEVPESFQNLDNLEYCDFYGNQLEYVNPCVINLKSLKGVDFECNYLDFNTLCKSQEAFMNFKIKYCKLKEYYRMRLNEIREDSQKLRENTTILEVNYSSEDSDNELGCYSVIDGECNTLITEYWDECVQKNRCTSSDDDFDPNDNRPHEELKNRKIKNPFKGNFCPADSHAPSLKLHFHLCQNEDTVDGQYELN